MSVSFPWRVCMIWSTKTPPYKALEAASALSYILTWTQSKDCWSVCCKEDSCFIQEEREAGLMTEVFPLKKEI